MGRTTTEKEMVVDTLPKTLQITTRAICGNTLQAIEHKYDLTLRVPSKSILSVRINDYRISIPNILSYTESLVRIGVRGTYLIDVWYADIDRTSVSRIEAAVDIDTEVSLSAKLADDQFEVQYTPLDMPQIRMSEMQGENNIIIVMQQILFEIEGNVNINLAVYPDASDGHRWGTELQTPPRPGIPPTPEIPDADQETEEDHEDDSSNRQEWHVIR